MYEIQYTTPFSSFPIKIDEIWNDLTLAQNVLIKYRKSDPNYKWEIIDEDGQITIFFEPNTCYNINVLEGLIVNDITCQDDIITFFTSKGVFEMRHIQDCCETVTLEDVCGDLSDLIGTTIIQSGERTNKGTNPSDSETWTFYHISTKKGTVTLRWYGTSNGCYSEEVDFIYIG